ncbi:cysteine and histidine-rich domain-containing protein RAR1 [Amaranthus tricolor]|uniref:cysteine and histidine-rich domain-containing protein RAR1 n=1 Tax=Amaranthus tricolor TaxID=29722 RepID=UPI0025871D51|nr:cysteine and histidine-rich domain-containing protein RAR1 [Amaranthus tricolor]
MSCLADICFILHDSQWISGPFGLCFIYQGPIFHDGMKEWSCCKKRSHDFSLFLEIPGCQTGQHTTEKPILTKVAPTPRKPVAAPIPVSGCTTTSPKETCSRCKQGFFCSDHGSQPYSIPVQAAAPGEGTENVPAPPRKKVGINEPQICKNKGCGQTFKEIDNHDAACNYHPGPAIFHDRMRGWKCCDVHVKEFDEFMTIPPCAKGWHNADPS